MGYSKAYEYYCYIVEQKKEEMAEMRKAQDKVKHGNQTTMDCPPPEGDSWDETIMIWTSEAEEKARLRNES